MSTTKTIKERLSEIDDPVRWLGFFATAIEQGNPSASALTLADEAYINDFPPEEKEKKD